jgi:MFS family permease
MAEVRETSGGHQHYLLVSLPIMAVATALTATQYKLPSIIPQIIEAGILDMGAITVLMSIFSFAGIIFAIPAGALIGRIGPKLAIMLATAAAFLASLAVFTENVAAMVAFRVVEGISLYVVIVAGPVLIQQAVRPEKRGVATGIYIVGGMLGAFVAGLATPMLFGLGRLDAVWVGYGVFTLLTGAIVLLVVRGGKAAARTGARGAVGEAAPKLYRAIFSKDVLLLFASFVIFQVMLIGTISFSPTFLQQSGFDAGLSGVVSTLPMLMAIVSSVAFGAIADKTGSFKAVYITGFAAMCVSMLLMFAGTGPELWIGVVAMGLLGMGTPAIAMAAYPQMLRSPEAMSLGMGVMIVVQCIGQFIGTTLPAALLGPDINGWFMMSAVMLAMGVLGLVCAALCTFKRGKG